MPKPIALQLYSLREEAAEDFPAVLKQVADMGYIGVEFAGIHDMAPAEVKKIIDDLGLQVCSAHMPMPTKENAQELIDDCKTLGVPRLVTGPGGPIDTMGNIMACVEKQNEAVAALEGSGIEFGLHNHWAEFEQVEGKLPGGRHAGQCSGPVCAVGCVLGAGGRSRPGGDRRAPQGPASRCCTSRTGTSSRGSR